MTHEVGIYRGEAVDWDRFASTQEGYTHFHRFAGENLIEEVLGPAPIAVLRRGQ